MIIKANEVDNAINIDYRLSEVEDTFNVIYLDQFLFPLKSSLVTMNIFFYELALLFTTSFY